MPYKIPSMANTPYRPSNGTEGMMFEEKFCFRCRYYQDQGPDDPGCPITMAAFFFEADDPQYPKQYWIHDENGEPKCDLFWKRKQED